MALTPTCHPERKHEAHGFCEPCYQRWRVAHPPDRRKARTPDCHPERAHVGRGLCQPCYTRWYYEQKYPGAAKRDTLPSEVPAEVQAEETAFAAQQAFERRKADRRRQAQEDAGRREVNRLPRRHPLYADLALLREMEEAGCVSWNVVMRIRELRQGPGWSIRDIASLFGVKPGFVALCCSHVDLNVVDLPKTNYARMYPRRSA